MKIIIAISMNKRELNFKLCTNKKTISELSLVKNQPNIEESFNIIGNKLCKQNWK